jgi:hypothetical protein
MNPTLSVLDLLEVQPYGGRPPRRGDVILFTPEGCDQPIVHRIAELASSGVVTRGDNATADDPWRLERNEIFGRVIAACRGNRRRRIAGGAFGRLGACGLRLWKMLYRTAAWLYRIAHIIILKNCRNS